MNGLIDELKRQAKTTDMMITMHSIISSKFYGRALFIDCTLLISSAILTIFIFFDYNILKSFNVDVENAKFIINISSLMTFILSLISIVVNWKGKSEKHDQACTQLSKLKDDYRVLLSNEGQIDGNTLKDQTLKYNQILNYLPKIPNNKFNKLKLIHKRKVLISKIIDSHPGVFLWLLKLKVYLRYNKKILSENIEKY